uniref:acyltransferase family protein n=1 Tax=Paenibacillus sp. FSL E2-0201 TaxID=2954726 RepID=UPI00403F3976
MSNLVLLHTYNFWLFIQFLVMLYVMFYFVYKFVPESKRIVWSGILSVIFLLFVKNNLWSGQAFSFLIGIVFAKYSDQRIKLSKTLFITGIGLLIGLLSLAIKQTDFIRNSNYIIFNTNQVILNLATAIGMIYLFYSSLKLKILQLFAIAGAASYEIYLIHTLLIFIIKK